jgi:hypothetical protein
VTKTLYCQTDTTGRFLFREQITYTGQPHLVRLACVIADEKEIIGEWCYLIRPRGSWVFEDDAVVAHGVSPETAQRLGVPQAQAVGRLIGWLDDVDRVCAFNLDFHSKVLQRAAFECQLHWQHLFHDKVMACAMRRATDIVRIPRMAPGGGFSWPKLRDAYEFFSDGEELPPPDLDPIERGIALARCVYLIDRGIIDHQHGAAHE